MTCGTPGRYRRHSGSTGCRGWTCGASQAVKTSVRHTRTSSTTVSLHPLDESRIRRYVGEINALKSAFFRACWRQRRDAFLQRLVDGFVLGYRLLAAPRYQDRAQLEPAPIAYTRPTPKSHHRPRPPERSPPAPGGTPCLRNSEHPSSSPLRHWLSRSSLAPARDLPLRLHLRRPSTSRAQYSTGAVLPSREPRSS